MLDSNIEKQHIAIQVPNSLDNIKSIIEAVAKKHNLELLDVEKVETNTDYPGSIKGAILYNDSSFFTGLHIAMLLRTLPKILIISETDLPIQTEAMEIYNPRYKKIGERIEKYIDDLSKSSIQTIIEDSPDGFAYHTYGTIRTNPYKGLFISIDYPDKSVGSIIAQRLTEQLAEEEIQTIYTNEPTNEISGGIIKSATVGKFDILPDALQLLYTIDRIEHARIIHEELKTGTTVITARYALTTLAYSYQRLPLGFLIAANAQVYWPDINFILTNTTPQQRTKKKTEKEERNEQINQGLQLVDTLFNKTTYTLDIDRPAEILVKQCSRIIKAHPKYKKLKRNRISEQGK